MCCVKHRPRQASSQTCNVQEDECRPPALFLSLPPQVWKIAFIQPLNQKLTLPSFTAATDGDRAHLTSTKRSPRWSRGKDEGGVKDKQARRGEISESVRRWLINKVVGWGVRRLDTADWYSTEIACHSRSASLHNRCWSGRAEGVAVPLGTFRIKNSDLWHHFLPTQQCCRGPLEVFRLLTLFFFPSVLFRAVVAFLKSTEVSNNVVPLFTSSATTSHSPSLSLSPHDASASRGSEAITQAHFNFLISAGIDGQAAAGQKAKSIILHYRTAGVKSRSPYDCRKPLRSRKQTPDLCTLIYLPFSP